MIPVPNIAIVEDDEEMRALLASTLVSEGYAPCSYRNGLEFLEDFIGSAGMNEIDLLICDVRMPGVTGMSLLEGLRELAEAQELEVILITAFGTAETHSRAQRLGAAAVLDKPFEMAALLAAVSGALQPRDGPPTRSESGSVSSCNR